MLKVDVNVKKNSRCFLSTLKPFESKDNVMVIQGIETYIIHGGEVQITTDCIKIIQKKGEFYFKIDDISNVFFIRKEKAKTLGEKIARSGERVEHIGDKGNVL